MRLFAIVLVVCLSGRLVRGGQTSTGTTATVESITVAGGEALSPTVPQSVLTTYTYATPPLTTTLADSSSGTSKRVSLLNGSVARVGVRTEQGSFLLGGDTSSVQISFQQGAWRADRQVTWYADSLQATISASYEKVVALDAEGLTLAIGNIDTGQTLIYTRSGTAWSKQATFTPTGRTGTGGGVDSAAFSADGNTLALGMIWDANFVGAVFVWTRSGSTWTQQAKLTMSDAVGQANVGSAVALSADGNTLAIGGRKDSNSAGAAWVWTRSGSTWTQQSGKLVGSGAVGAASQAYSLAISSDGNTLAVSGYSDNNYAGALWIFVRSGSTWTQQGAKLAGDALSEMATWLAMTSDGNRVVAAARWYGSGLGGAYVFDRSNTTWTQSAVIGLSGTDTLGSWVAVSSTGGAVALAGGTYSSSLYIFTEASPWQSLSGSTAIATSNHAEGAADSDLRHIAIVQTASVQIYA